MNPLLKTINLHLSNNPKKKLEFKRRNGKWI